MIRDFVIPAALLSLAQLTFCQGKDTLVESAPETAVTAIPADMRGRWGMVPADCDVTRSDAKGAMLVSAQMLGFYESRAQLGRILEVAPDRIEASYDFSGEGQSWDRVVTLDLSGDGQTLTRVQTDPETGPVHYDYRRCS